MSAYESVFIFEVGCCHLCFKDVDTETQTGCVIYLELHRCSGAESELEPREANPRAWYLPCRCWGDGFRIRRSLVQGGKRGPREEGQSRAKRLTAGKVLWPAPSFQLH